MNTAPLLTICIATYNRADYISETLESIISQLADDVELLVVDGASTDNTEAIVQRHVDNEHRIRYVRLPVKGGIDQDYCKSVELSRGEYCWLFTDDDLLKPGAVAAVKAAINDGNGLIVVNAEVRNRKLTTILRHRLIVLKENKMYAPEDIESFCLDALNYLSFIGAVVIRRSIWLSREPESYFGTEFVHIGVIFQKPLAEPVLIVTEPYICIRYGNGQWKPRSFEIWMFKWPKLIWSFDNISDQAKRHVTQKEPWRNLRILLLERGKGTYTIQHYYHFFAMLPCPELWKACAWLISQLPIKVLSRFLYCASRLTKADLIQLADLSPEE
jgi:glycosyltransferase involved in cell wall biosynthesis